jgi:hypothetical protein
MVATAWWPDWGTNGHDESAVSVEPTADLARPIETLFLAMDVPPPVVDDDDDDDKNDDDGDIPTAAPNA